MRRASLIGTGLLLMSALPAAAQRLERETTAPPPAAPSAARTWRINDMLGAQVTYRDGQATGKVVDVVVNSEGGIAAVVIRTGKDLVSVPWRSVRFDRPAVAERVMSTKPYRRLERVESRLDRFSELDARPEPAVVIPVVRGTVGRPALLFDGPMAYRMDSLYDRDILMTTPTDRPADLLKDRFEAHRAPPSRPWLRPVTRRYLPLHSSVR